MNIPAFNFQQPNAFDVAGQLASGFGNWSQNAVAQPYAAPAPQQQQSGFGFNTGTFDALGSIAQGAGSLFGAYTGFKQLGLAKDQLAFQKEAFAKNWANQVATTNMQLRDRQRARQGASSYARDTGSYLQENAVR